MNNHWQCKSAPHDVLWANTINSTLSRTILQASGGTSVLVIVPVAKSSIHALATDLIQKAQWNAMYHVLRDLLYWHAVPALLTCHKVPLQSLHQTDNTAVQCLQPYARPA